MGMTGKELITIILDNDLLNEDILTDETLDKIFISDEKAAAKLGVGVETIKLLYAMDVIEGFKFSGKLYLLKKDFR